MAEPGFSEPAGQLVTTDMTAKPEPRRNPHGHKWNACGFHRGFGL